ncbi:MAG: folylpolyglutamate synthase/dihydrofolate synthase family protein [Bacteroidales bacterium]
MTYKGTIDFLYSRLPAYHRIGKAAYKNNLDNTLALDEYFGHPHVKYKTVHVAGTNGKGSVSHMIASILQEAGYRTGLYTSPHLKDFRERIRINGKMIPRKNVMEFVLKNKGIISSLEPSFFELTVAMAFDYFARASVDVAVIEVGLGGRLDSTNIIDPVLSIITNIGHDHMDLLGDTIQKIAFEKAGIIKDNTAVIIGETQDDTAEVFNKKAAQTGSAVFFADSNFGCRLEKPSGFKSGRKYLIKDFSDEKEITGMIPLGGDYQEKNLKTVFQAAKVLNGVFNISDEDITRGIGRTVTNTHLMGRWQILGTRPLVICDTGHNREGLEYVVRQISIMPAARLRMVMGFVADKDLSLVIPLLPKDAEYYFTRASIPRALDEKKLQSLASEAGLHGNSFPSVKEAIDAAMSDASGDDLVFIGGSTYIVAEAL